jgi:hypothetical protein
MFEMGEGAYDYSKKYSNGKWLSRYIMEEEAKGNSIKDVTAPP